MTRLKNFRSLLALFFLLFYLPACSKPPSPESRSWEHLPHVNLDWIHPGFGALVTNTAGITSSIDFSIDILKTGQPLVFRPATGNYRSISYITNGGPNTIRARFDFSREIDKSPTYFASHSYFNGQYEYSDNYANKTGANLTYIRDPNLSYTLNLTDTWYFIYVFQGTDGKDYQYRTPVMSVANAI